MALTQYDPGRAVSVTIGLSGAGAVFGGLAGAGVLAVTAAVFGDLSIMVDPGLLRFAGGIGALLGAVCAPVAGWLLLRRVPLGRAFGALTLGTIIGGVIGLFSPFMVDSIAQPFAAGTVGFLLTAMVLRFTHGRPVPRRGSE